MEPKIMWARPISIKSELNQLLRKTGLSKEDFSKKLVDYISNELNCKMEDTPEEMTDAVYEKHYESLFEKQKLQEIEEAKYSVKLNKELLFSHQKNK